MSSRPTRQPAHNSNRNSNQGGQRTDEIDQGFFYPLENDNKKVGGSNTSQSKFNSKPAQSSSAQDRTVPISSRTRSSTIYRIDEAQGSARSQKPNQQGSGSAQVRSGGDRASVVSSSCRTVTRYVVPDGPTARGSTQQPQSNDHGGAQNGGTYDSRYRDYAGRSDNDDDIFGPSPTPRSRKSPSPPSSYRGDRVQKKTRGGSSRAHDSRSSSAAPRADSERSSSRPASSSKRSRPVAAVVKRSTGQLAVKLADRSIANLNIGDRSIGIEGKSTVQEKPSSSQTKPKAIAVRSNGQTSVVLPDNTYVPVPLIIKKGKLTIEIRQER